MFGFSFLINRQFSVRGGVKCSIPDNYEQYDSIALDNCIAVNHMIEKFADDKIFYKDDNYIVVLDGIVLNRKDFIARSAVEKEWSKVLIDLYETEGEDFFKRFKGSFSGILYDSKKDKVVFFSDHIGSKFMYYYLDDNCFYCSSYIDSIYSFLKYNNIAYSLSIENAYLLLSYGYMLEDRTLCNEVKKLRPGCYISIENNSIRNTNYFLLNNIPDNSISESDAIEMMDSAFRNAVQLQFDKDLEYGYKHFVALSAGLDSRMVSWVAHEMGYKNQLNFTFSQNNYWDQTVPQQISSRLKHEWIFKSLDNGLWLYNIDDVVKTTGGNVLYFGQAHSHSLVKYIDFSSLGLVHSGQQGDIAFDTYYTSNDVNKQFILGEGAFSLRYLDRIRDIKLSEYANEEIAHYYCRSFSGANNGLVPYNNYTEVKSPFADIDVLNTILSIPLKFRTKRNLYFKWILSKYPEAGDFVWDHIGMPISRTKGIIVYHGSRIPVEQIPQLIKKKFFKRGNTGNKGMNPLGYYLSTNIELKEYLHKYIVEGLPMIPDTQLRRDIESILDRNDAIETIQAVTLISSLHNFFC